MRQIVESARGGGENGHEVLPPPTLALVVGELDRAVWVDLDPGHPEHEFFLGPYFLQEDWDWATHLWFWQTNLERWPTDLRKRSTSGLAARQVALWRKAGYSKSQITAALGYSAKGLPRTVWELAEEYLEWLAERPYLYPADLGAQRNLENLWAETAERAGGSAHAESLRREYRNRERTPRVVSDEDRGYRGFPSFGHPEEFSTRFLDQIDPGRQQVRANLERAAIALADESPKGRPLRLPRRPHLTTPAATR